MITSREQPPKGTTMSIGTVAIVRRRERLARDAAAPGRDRFRPVYSALAEVGVAARSVAYADEIADAVREELLACDGVLVWVDPISDGRDRSVLDALLRDVAAAGTWVSAHPDVIVEMGTKSVLYRTRHLGWGTDTHTYPSFSDFAQAFPTRLASGGPRVLKPQRGNGGLGVWKVERLDDARRDAAQPGRAETERVRVQHAAPRDAVTEVLALASFVERWRTYFTGANELIDQAFAARLPEGLIRAYVVRDRVVGFARQRPADPATGAGVPPPDKVLGLPAAKTMYDRSEPEFAALRARLEAEWIPGLLAAVNVDRGELPLLWDADFLYGPPAPTGEDTHILCEINVSSVSPFPDPAPRELARAVRDRLERAAPGSA